jgi:GAG-pre-integrase domain
MMVKQEDAVVWHRRFGHASLSKLIELKKIYKELKDVKLPAKLDCIQCSLGKICKSPFPPEDKSNTTLFSKVVSDICGPFRTKFIGGSEYLMTVIDVFSRCLKIYTLEDKESRTVARVLETAIKDLTRGTYTVKTIEQTEEVSIVAMRLRIFSPNTISVMR